VAEVEQSFNALQNSVCNENVKKLETKLQPRPTCWLRFLTYFYKKSGINQRTRKIEILLSEVPVEPKFQRLLEICFTFAKN